LFERKFLLLPKKFMKKRANTIKQGFDLAADYCSREERYHRQVEEKLKDWGLNYEQIQQVIVELIAADYLSEERYAKLFAISKLRQNKWGKIKIRSALKEKYISDYCISKAFDEIDPLEYQSICTALCNSKLQELKGEISPLKEQKLYRYMFAKGFEFEMVKSILKAANQD
jgi:regulatory protein